MVNTLPRDTYYRGYRLSIFNEGRADMTIHIFHGTDHVDTTHALQKAKKTIDEWVEAA